MVKDDYFLLRRRKEITLQEIADYVGCTHASLSKYERNKQNLDKYKVEKYQEFILNYED